MMIGVVIAVVVVVGIMSGCIARHLYARRKAERRRQAEMAKAREEQYIPGIRGFSSRTNLRPCGECADTSADTL